MCSRLRGARLGRPLQALRKGDSRESEGGRALAGDCEGALKGDADATQCAFFIEAADQRDAVGHAARRRETKPLDFSVAPPVPTPPRSLTQAAAPPQRTG